MLRLLQHTTINWNCYRKKYIYYFLVLYTYVRFCIGEHHRQDPSNYYLTGVVCSYYMKNNRTNRKTSTTKACSSGFVLYTLSLPLSFLPQNWSNLVLALSRTSAATDGCDVGDTMDVSTPPWLFCVASVGLNVSPGWDMIVAISKDGSSTGNRLSPVMGEGWVSELEEPPPFTTGLDMSRTLVSSMGVRLGGLVGVFACFRFVTTGLCDISTDFGGVMSDLLDWCMEASSENVLCIM